MSEIIYEIPAFDITVPVVVIGAGACGSIAALAARDNGAEVLVLDRDTSPGGSTALSSGFIPACETRWQTAIGETDSVAIMSADIQRKAKGRADPVLTDLVARTSGPTLEWLADRHGIPFVLLEGFKYPGHTALRMHAHAEQTGRGLITALHTALSAADIDIMTDAHVTALYADRAGKIHGVRVARPDGSTEAIGCAALVLACNGYGGSREMLEQYIPEMAPAIYFGHVGNQGDAVKWGDALGAGLADMGAYQGHGSVAWPHAVLISWALMMEGGIQVNLKGERFSNENQGYSEQAVDVLAQPEGIAWDIYDQRLHDLGMTFDDYRQAEKAGAVRRADDPAALAALIDLPAGTLQQTLDHAAALQAGRGEDVFGRDFTQKPPLSGPFYAIRVTGTLFHTQGGLTIDDRTRVMRPDGSLLPNLFAGGGAARGVSGPAVWGYLSGNGLLTAVSLGRLAGEAAADQVTSDR
ncbi:MAG: FAD-dependent oxidoreductase [Rhodospirillales bacterium]